MMEFTADKKYLVLPVNRDSVRKKLEFYSGGRLVYDLDCHFDPDNPEQKMYVDMTPFSSVKLTVRIEGCRLGNYAFETADSLPEGTYKEPYRPFAHYTEAYGWTNDPNGLFFSDGEYHMFYQHNPAGTPWGNMHWGHAYSADLMKWTQTDEALYPDRFGTMYSGSALVDRDNVSGLSDGKTPPVLLYYTAAGDNSLLSRGKKFTQNLAFSTDGGKTFAKYGGNPVISHIIGGNRDPKVIFCPDIGKFVLALYLDGNDYGLFSSGDLINWEQFQTVTLENDSECPDFYPLSVEGTDEVRWVLSGASDRYLVGHFDRGRFTADQQALSYQYGGSRWYAAQSFDNTPERLKIYWAQVNAPRSPFTHQMSVPLEVTLAKVDELYRLREVPSRHVQSLYEADDTWNSIRVSGVHRHFLPKSAYDIRLEFGWGDCDFDITLFGRTVTVKPRENKFAVDGTEAPLSHSMRKPDLRIVADRLSFEIFADGGLIFLPKAVVCDYSLPFFTVASDNVLFDKYSMSRFGDMHAESNN